MMAPPLSSSVLDNSFSSHVSTPHRLCVLLRKMGHDSNYLAGSHDIGLSGPEAAPGTRGEPQECQGLLSWTKLGTRGLGRKGWIMSICQGQITEFRDLIFWHEEVTGCF